MAKVKQKTHRGAAKRFKLVAGGKRVKHRKSNRNHIKTKQDQKRKLHARKMGLVVLSDILSVFRMLRRK